MSDLFYSSIKWTWRWPICWCQDLTLIGREYARLNGPFIIASNHTSPFDIALLIYHVRERLDFVSSTEVFSVPVLGQFYGAMNAFPLDRSKTDSKTVRTILQRLSAGRSIAMFPEGAFRLQDRSVLHGGKIQKGIGRIARIAQVPVIPCAIEDSLVFSKPRSWVPIRQSRYGIAFGEPIPPPAEGHVDDDTGAFESDLAERIRGLHRGLLEKMGRTEDEAATRRYHPGRS